MTKKAQRGWSIGVGTAANHGRGKQLPADQGGTPIPDQPRNRRERRALAAWQRKQAKKGQS